MQRASIAEQLSETIHGLEGLTVRVCSDGVVTRAELCLVRHAFARTKREARIVNTMQSTGLRLIRTGNPDKNLITELRALAACGGPDAECSKESGQDKAPAGQATITRKARLHTASQSVTNSGALRANQNRHE